MENIHYLCSVLKNKTVMAFVKRHTFQVGDKVILVRVVSNHYGWFEDGTIMTIIQVNKKQCTYDLVDDEGNKAEDVSWNDIRFLETNYIRYRDKISQLKRKIHDAKKHGANIEIRQDVLECLHQAEKQLEEAEKEITDIINKVEY